MGVEFVHVVTESERKQGEKLIGGFLAVLFALVAVYFAVVYWQVTLVVLGLLVLAVVLGMLTSRR